MEETSTERKARLAALRKGRKNVSNSIIESSTVKTNEIDSSKSDIKKQEMADSDQSFSEEAQQNHEMPKTIPSLRISENEIVELVAATIQEQIFEQIYAESTNDTDRYDEIKAEKNIYTKDLEKDLSKYLRLAKFKTDQALNKIIQKKYQDSLTEQTT